MKRDIERGAYTVTDAATFMGVSYPTMQSLLEVEDFPAMRLGKRWIIPKIDLIEWMSKKARERAVIETK